MAYKLNEYTKFLYSDNLYDVMNDKDEDEIIIDTTGVHIRKDVYEYLVSRYHLIDDDIDINKAYKKDRQLRLIYENSDKFFELSICTTESEIKDLIYVFKENTKPIYLYSVSTINTCLILLLTSNKKVELCVDSKIIKDYFNRIKSLLFTFNGMFDNNTFLNFIKDNNQFLLLYNDELYDIEITEDGFYHQPLEKYIPINKIYKHYIIPKDFGGEPLLLKTKIENSLYKKMFKILMYELQQEKVEEVLSLKKRLEVSE